MVGGDENHWHILINQRNRAMLHLCCRIALSMDITDFLKFQSSLKSYRIVEATTHIKSIAGIGQSARNVFCQSILLQHLLHLLWYERQLCNVFLKLHLGNAAQFMTQSQGKEGKNHHLTGKRLG